MCGGDNVSTRPLRSTCLRGAKNAGYMIVDAFGVKNRYFLVEKIHTTIAWLAEYLVLKP